jgi:hypothetical protein
MKIDTALYNNEKRHQLEGYIHTTVCSGVLGRIFVCISSYCLPYQAKFNYLNNFGGKSFVRNNK